MGRILIDSDVCFECGKRMAHLHHVVPAVKGGIKTLPLCGICHAKVHDRRKMATSHLVKAGLKKRTDKGLAHGKPPYGYEVGTDGKLKVHDEELWVIKAILYMYNRDNFNYSMIADDLNNTGIPTRTGSQWHRATIRKIVLRSEQSA